MAAKKKAKEEKEALTSQQTRKPGDAKASLKFLAGFSFACPTTLSSGPSVSGVSRFLCKRPGLFWDGVQGKALLPLLIHVEAS